MPDFGPIGLQDLYGGQGEVTSSFTRTSRVNPNALAILTRPFSHCDIRAYTSLNAAITSIGSANVTLLINAGTVLTGNLTVPSNVSIEAVYPGSINQDAYTLTINGPFSAPLAQVFTGSGTVTFGKISTVYPEWWGAVEDGTTDDGTAVNAAATSLSIGGVVKITRQLYSSITVTLPSHVYLVRDGEGVPGEDKNTWAYSNYPGTIILNSATATIATGAVDSGVKRMTVIAAGLGLPYTSAAQATASIATWTGVGITVNALDSCVTDNLILGFGTGILVNGSPGSTKVDRHIIERNKLDCINCIDIEDVYDVGYLNNNRVWTFLTTHRAWSASLSARPGTAFKLYNCEWIQPYSNAVFGWQLGWDIAGNSSNVTLFGGGSDTNSGWVSNGILIEGNSGQITIDGYSFSSMTTGITINTTADANHNTVKIANSSFWSGGNAVNHVHVQQGALKLIGNDLTGGVSGSTVLVDSTASAFEDHANTYQQQTQGIYSIAAGVPYFRGINRYINCVINLPSSFNSPAISNFISYPNDADNAVWTKVNITVSANAITAPDGTVTGDTLSDGTNAGNHNVKQTSLTITAGQPYTASIYFQYQSSLRYMFLQFYNAGGSKGFFATFDLQLGTSKVSVNGSDCHIMDCSIVPIENVSGWYRCSISGIVSAADTSAILAYGATTSSSATWFGASYTGSNQTVGVWGAQVHPGSVLQRFTANTI